MPHVKVVLHLALAHSRAIPENVVVKMLPTAQTENVDESTVIVIEQEVPAETRYNVILVGKTQMITVVFVVVFRAAL